MKASSSKIWSGWKKFARWLGRAQVILILTVFYIIVIVPLGLVYRLIYLFSGKTDQSTWVKHSDPDDYHQYFRRQG